ncbi:MAG: hypothetical protein ACI4AQ_08240 [Lachnospiraceae bacterium]
MISEKNYCPLCKKRIFDFGATQETMNISFFIELKCPNCRNIVRVHFNKGTEVEVK